MEMCDINVNLEHVGYRWKYEGEDKWAIVKHIPKWYEPFMTDVVIEKVYVINV